VYSLTKQTVGGQPHGARLRCIRVLVSLMREHEDNYLLQKNIFLTLCNFHVQVCANDVAPHTERVLAWL
jgi:hypothetical protein